MYVHGYRVLGTSSYDCGEKQDILLPKEENSPLIFQFCPNSGQVPSVAEKNFLASVKGLDMYGVDPHPCKVSQIEGRSFGPQAAHTARGC